MSDDRALDHWLQRLTRSLHHLTPEERQDIVREARTHVEDRVEAGRSLSAVLAELGSAERYARQFFDEMEGDGAIASIGRCAAGDAHREMVCRAHRNFATAGTMICFLLLAVAAGLAAMLAVLKVFDPMHAGVWVGPNISLIGVIDDPHSAREILGPWIFPLAALLLGAAWRIGRALLALAIPLLLPRSATALASLGRPAL